MNFTKQQDPSSETETVLGMADPVKEPELQVLAPDPGKYFIITYVEERGDFWTREVDGNIPEDEFINRYIRHSSIRPPFIIIKGKEIKIRR